mgnify:CR=1 FL=1
MQKGPNFSLGYRQHVDIYGWVRLARSSQIVHVNEMHSNDLEYQIKYFLEIDKIGRIQFANNTYLRAFIRKILSARGNERLLDLGCGIGTVGKLLSPLFKNGGEIVGIDLNHELVEYGNDHWARPPHIRLEVGDANNIPYPERYFQIVTSMGLYENVANLDRVLSETLRVLTRPGKILSIHIDMDRFIVTPCPEFNRRCYKDFVRGMQVVGIDVDAKRFITTCKRRNLIFKEFQFVMEYKTQITDNFIKIMKEMMQSYYQNKKIMQKFVEFHFQFMRWIGWSYSDVWDAVHYLYSHSDQVAFLIKHKGEIYYRKTPMRIFLIQIFEESQI